MKAVVRRALFYLFSYISLLSPLFGDVFFLFQDSHENTISRPGQCPGVFVLNEALQEGGYIPAFSEEAQFAAVIG